RAEVQILALRLGAVAENPILAGGVQACDPHHRGSGPLKPGELIIVDLFPQLSETRYWGDMTRTYLKGRASAAQRRLFDTVAKAQKLAMKEIQAGRPGKAVHQRVHRYFTEQGYQTGELNGRRQGFFHGTGHGLGLEIHEAPNLGESGTSKLEKGNVVTVEPGLYYPSIGGVRIEDVVAVTASGCRKLSRFPVELEL
ncbi:MAG: aminopeptidase P family protein, partial [Verrucomicrobiae bacterium]|nr:aminopeptidase P family protein [Verrucomicrobiae bacterium]